MSNPLLSIPPHPDIPRTVIPALEHHATALGYICFAWANLESSVNKAIETLIGCSNDVRRVLVDGMGASIGPRCEIILKLASMNPASKDWIDDLSWVINNIRDGVGPKRNRLVHDGWMISPDGPPTQRDERTKLHKEAAYAATKIRKPQLAERQLDEMWDLERQITRAAVDLHYLTRDHAIWCEQGLTPEYRPSRQ